jgi:DNA polymerase-1|tara:strand:- start:1983 stop:3962 length:1980 start_codon:yes stop_codon:yes gene_type:complete
MLQKEIKGLFEETGFVGLSKDSSFEEREVVFEKFYQRIKDKDKAENKALLTGFMNILNSIFSSHELLEKQGIKVCYITNPAPAKEVVKKLSMVKAHLALDIETAKLCPFEENQKAGLDPRLSKIRLIQIYDGGCRVYIFNMFVLNKEILKPLWDKKMVAHNAVFELKHLNNVGIFPSSLDCTMLMGNAITNKLRKLKVLAMDRLGWLVGKDLQTSDWGVRELTTEQLEYAALDAVVAWKLFFHFQNALQKTGRGRVYKLMRDAQQIVAKLESNGIYFDVTSHKRLISKWEKSYDIAKEELVRMLDPDVNFNSGRQLSAWLHEKMDDKTLHDWPRTKTGQLSTSAETLNMFSEHPWVKPLREYKEVNKKIKTYGEKYAAHISPATGRVHSSFILGGTATSRFSCRAPNVQNPLRDKEFRQLFCSPEGRVLIIADYSQIELRVAAIISGDRAMLEAYAQGQDLHVKTAALIAGIREEEVTSAQRQAAKAVNFGMLYGMGANGLSKYAMSNYGVNMSELEATGAINSFFKAYPSVKKWQMNITRSVELTKQVETPGGRVRNFAEEGKDSFYTESLNTPIQGGAAEVLLIALARLDYYLTGLDAKLVNIIHDEIILEVTELDAGKTTIALEKAMVEGFLALFPNGGIKNLVEIKSVNNWAEAK